MRGISTHKRLINYLFFAFEFAGLIALIVTENYRYIGMIIGNIVFWAFYLFIEAKMDWYLPIYIRIMVVLSILCNGILGGVFKLYLTAPSFDQVLHIVASYSVAVWVYYIVQQFTGVIITKKKLHFVMIVCFSLALGAFYEILEFAIDHIIKLKVKNQASLYDTDLDMISDLIGGIIASFHFVFSSRLNSFLISLKQLEGNFQLKDNPKRRGN